MIEVEAKQIGFYGNRRRYPKYHAKYETFLVDKVDGSWMRVIEKNDKPTLAELNQGGAQSPPAPQDSTGGNWQSNDDEQGSSVPLSRMNKDDLIALAVDRGLSENVDLTQLNRSQLIGIIKEHDGASTEGGA